MNDDGVHEQIETPGWDTKLRCACGAEFATKAQLKAHLNAPPTVSEAR